MCPPGVQTHFLWQYLRTVLSSPCRCVMSYVLIYSGSHDSLAAREMMTSRVADVTSVCGLTMTNMVRWLSAVVTWSMLESWNALFDILLLMLCCGRKKVKSTQLCNSVVWSRPLCSVMRCLLLSVSCLPLTQQQKVFLMARVTGDIVYRSKSWRSRSLGHAKLRYKWLVSQ